MKIQYTISDNVLSRRVDKNGLPLHTHEVFIYDAVKRVLFDKFTKEFSLSNVESVLIESKKEAENRILRLNQWIECFTLIKSKFEIEYIINQSQNHKLMPQNNINQEKLMDINNRLADFKKHEKDILECLNKHNKQVRDVSTRWIAENMPNFSPFGQESVELAQI